MSRIQARHVFTSESVSEGHPDKVCDQISDAILDACLEQDPESRVACETLVTTDLIVLSGEITTNADVPFEAVARRVVRDIGYTAAEVGFSADTCRVQTHIHRQSPDISQGVRAEANAYHEQGAGDQGMMFGFATNETDELMPAPILYAHRIVKRLAELRKTDPDTAAYLLPDGKSQVSFLYEGGSPVRVETVVVSHQHTPDVGPEDLRPVVERVVKEVIPARFLSGDVRYLVNPTGRFVVGGPNGDTGLTGRKIIVDTYGGVGCHGGGAFSGKDPSKVDRSGAYMCRYVAKNVVASGLADKCEVQVAYAIGVPEPVSANIDAFGTATVPEARLQELVFDSDLFDFRPARIIERFRLTRPGAEGWTYLDTAAYGHFGRNNFPWEATDAAVELRKLAGGG
ncbi:MAG: methionine adenosyltransferase [Kiritimatiellaeota bacterium]|nr:methionine adenosyltransferase [Kiritimatiellota bacterium]